MTDELEREYEKLKEIETRYYQVMDTCKQIAAEWQAQMDEIRRIADGKETAEEQYIEYLKEQVEEEFVPEEDQVEEEPELDHIVMHYRDLANLVRTKGWCEKMTPKQWNIFLVIAGCKKDVTLKDVMDHAHTICKYSENVALEKVAEALLEELTINYVWKRKGSVKHITDASKKE